jgi:predicted anti-sigma-YlaC factor YlaD
MRCKKVMENLERFLDGTLGITRTAEIKEHLEVCSTCGTAFAEIRTLKSLLKLNLPSSVPGDITANIMEAAQNSFFSRKSNETGGISFLWWKEAAIPCKMAFAGILIMVLTAGVFIGKDLWNDPESLTFAEYPELEAFSAAQKGSIAYVYLHLTAPPQEGVKK